MDAWGFASTVGEVTLAVIVILAVVSRHEDPPDDDVDPEHPVTGIHL